MEKDLVSNLLEIKALEFKTNPLFTLSSGLKSPVYFDNRKTLSFPSLRNNILKGLLQIISDRFRVSEIDGIVGVATAGIPYGSLIAHELSMPFSYVRSAPKGHGNQNLVEGVLEKGQKVVVIEDVVSTGGSSLKGINALREIGVEVLGLVSVYSHEFDIARENFENHQLPCYNLLTLTDLILEGERISALSKNELSILNEWKTKH